MSTFLHQRASMARGTSGIVPMLRGATLWLMLLFHFVPFAPLRGQTQPESHYYYAVENLANGTVVQRGTTTLAGIRQGGLILAPNSSFRFWLLKVESGLLGFKDFNTPAAGQSFTIPQVGLGLPSSPDFDNDGLTDDAEFIVGTDPTNVDTDGDGIKDGAAVQLGLDVGSARTGIIGSADTPGNAVDVCALNDIVIVADSGRGISVFNVFNRMNPLIIAQVDTPGTAQRVACSGNLIAVADGAAGLAVIDVTDPPAARIVRQLSLGGTAQAVTAAGGIAYVGLSNGGIVAVDLAGGTILQRASVPGSIQDLGLGREYLYVLTTDKLHTFSIQDGDLALINSVTSPIFAAGNRRLFVGDGYAYAVQNKGVNTFSLTNPAAPVLVNAANTTQFGWKQFVPTGSRYAVAADDPNLALDGPNDISLYDLSNPTNTRSFVTKFPTPGIAFAVSIYNGLAYVADGNAGLQVINYLAYDNQGSNPAITLSASFMIANGTNGVLEEGKLARITASVTDDVQVRNVEFYIDDVKVATDGNFPFEYRFAAPSIQPGRASFRLRARASDTGGNFTWASDVVVQLVPDATPPRVVRTFPRAGGISGSLDTLTAFFNEPLDPASLNAEAFGLSFAGADGIWGNSDDAAVTSGTISYRAELNAVFLSFSTNIPPGSYRAVVRPPLADQTGNLIVTPFAWQFWVLGTRDSDQDGLPDEAELALGLDPNNPSTLNDGILDGNRDFDADGLPNAWELRFGYDPGLRDTDGNGIPDAQEDSDMDALNNLAEFTRGTNPRNPDSDGDGWDDAGELAEGTNPLDPRSGPRMLVTSSRGVTFLNAVREVPPAGVRWLVTTPSVVYLNAVPEAPPSNALWSAFSGLVTFRNDTNSFLGLLKP